MGCRNCAKFCNQDAIQFGPYKKASIRSERCVGCGRCIGSCNYHAIANRNASSLDALNCKMTEYAKAVLDGRPHFHISVVNQVSPYCDCHGENDVAVVPDLGIFASFDPVALDQACIDAVNAAPALPGSALSDAAADCRDHFTCIHPTTDWLVQIAHAEKIGLGRSAYGLVAVE